MSEIKAAAGFFDASGKLRSAEQLKEADAKAAQDQSKSKSSQTSAEATRFVSQTRSAFRKLRSSVSDKANTLISTTNTQIDSAKDARGNTKNQIQAAKTLKTALQENDQESIEAARTELADLQAAAGEIEKDIDLQNRNSATDRVGSIQFGNKQQQLFKIEAVDFQASTPSPEQLNSVEDVDSLIDSLKDTRSDLGNQISNLKSVRSEVREVARDTRQEFRELGDQALQTVEEAALQANKVAEQLRFAADTDLSAIQSKALQTVHTLTEDAVLKLVT